MATRHQITRRTPKCCTGNSLEQESWISLPLRSALANGYLPARVRLSHGSRSVSDSVHHDARYGNCMLLAAWRPREHLEQSHLLWEDTPIFFARVYPFFAPRFHRPALACGYATSPAVAPKRFTIVRIDWGQTPQIKPRKSAVTIIG